MTAHLSALGTAMPERQYKQAEVVDAFFARLPGWDPAWAEVFAASGVEWRASAVDVASFYATAPGTAARMRAFTPAARALGAQAARRALEQLSGGGADSVGDLLAVSCTGYDGPGLDVHLATDLGLGAATRRLAIGHMGCYAALPALRTAAALVESSGTAALVACVELCSLHLQPATSREEAVGQALFGDGAGAAVVTRDGPGPSIVAAHSAVLPDSEHRMGWAVDDEGFRMHLSPRVPALIERAVGPFVDDLLAAAGETRAGVAHWVVHPGGPEVLERIGRRLALGPARLERSWDALANGGNRSSATVLFILESLLRSGEVRRGDTIAMLAFGTGLTCEALLLRA